MSDGKYFPKVITLGHPGTENLLPSMHVEVTEKLDGSQFTFTVGLDGELECYSKTQRLQLDDNCNKMFKTAVEYCKSIKDILNPDLIYTGEAFRARRHNKLEYNTAPKQGFVLFSIRHPLYGVTGSYGELVAEANRIGVPVVQRMIPEVSGDRIITEEVIQSMLTQESMLGGAIEGVVIHNLSTGVRAKVVREEFKESMRRKDPKPKNGVAEYAEQYNTEARFRKAVQTLRDAGEITGESKDISKLMKEMNTDFELENSDQVKEDLYKMFRKEIISKVTEGFPKWYQQEGYKLVQGD